MAAGGYVAVVVVMVLLLLPARDASARGHDYGNALSKSILFFEAQRSGRLPHDQRVQWRSDSGLLDGKSSGLDLVGGYYDAGDNVKFGLPMAFTVTMMSWSLVEYGDEIAAAGEMRHAMEAVKWGTDYLIKAHPEANVLYGEVGDGNTDHYCWQRPEDMTTSRAAYRIDVNHPGSDLAGETAAAMASASMVFRRYDRKYADELLRHSEELFRFADEYRGKYDTSIGVAKKYYGSYSGYADELLWAAVWLYQATGKECYLDYLGRNGDALGGTGWAMTEFGWDAKYAGVQVLASKILMEGKSGRHTAVLERYKEKAESFICSTLGKGRRNVRRTPGGLLFRQRWNNLQFVTSASFLLSVYSDYLSSNGDVSRSVKCPSGKVEHSELFSLAKSQVDYILGDNPRATSYMVGYGSNYPKQVHHRGSSIVSIKDDPQFVSCRGGYAKWYGKKGSDPNLLVGAIVGGPDGYDNFADERDNYEQTEPTTYNNAPMLGLLARFAAESSGRTRTRRNRASYSPVAVKMLPKSGDANHAITTRQWMTAKWEYKGRKYYRYSTVVTNNTPKTIVEPTFTVSKLDGPLWGLNNRSKNRNDYTFPKWIKSLPAGKSLEFVYIHSASTPADVVIAGYHLI